MCNKVTVVSLIVSIDCCVQVKCLRIFSSQPPWCSSLTVTDKDTTADNTIHARSFRGLRVTGKCCLLTSTPLTVTGWRIRESGDTFAHAPNHTQSSQIPIDRFLKILKVLKESCLLDEPGYATLQIS